MPPKKQAHALEKSAQGSPQGSLFTHYDFLVQHEGINDDVAQRVVVGHLQTLHDALTSKKPAGLSRLLKKKTEKSPRSLYIWGNVGRGKSMLMEIFYAGVPLEKKRRVHFHAFMQEVHARIHSLRKEGRGDPVAILAHEIANETQLLCFDELQATDVADATLLYRLFEGLFAAGVVVVSTSNHPPTTLYTGGVQRERFDKFIALLQEKMTVVALSSPEDYRTLQIKSLSEVYHAGAGGAEFIAYVLETIASGEKPAPDTFMVQGRSIAFTRYGEGVGQMSFAAACEAALGPADYLTIAKRLSTLILTDIPALAPEKRNEAKRFVTLIDALYENKVKLIATAATEPAGIYAQGDGAFEFNRTVSRLMEMQSEKWLG